MNEVGKRHFPVAIVGMHGRFPGAYDVNDFWTNLVEGHNTFGLVPKERWDWQKLFGSSANENDCTTINCAAFMPLIDRFDPRYFGIMPREAESMDPQQRLFMQTAFAALEDAGYAPGSLSGSNTGVFVGIGNADYPGMMRREGAPFDLYRATGLALTCIPNRVSFSLNVHGPSEAIDTACSGSLVAIHRAIQSMQLGECDLAIAGGVSLLTGPDLFIAFDKAGMLSRSARCRTFDAHANGYVRGEGVAAIVLRPLEEAQKNGDYIYAVIQGSATNHGGRAHSFTAPNAAAQAQVVKTAWANSGKHFQDAFMIETHGTGTPLGDPIEVNGLKKVSEEFGLAVSAASAIALGALKSHVGHMEAAAGIGGVIKAVLSMKYRTVPLNLNFDELNPHIDLENTPYYIPVETAEIAHRQQQDGSHKLLAGVSSFGFGGVNAHVVLESLDDAVNQNAGQQDAMPYLIALSGKDKLSLQARVRQLIHFLKTSCARENTPTSQKILDALCDALGVSDITGPIGLASLNVAPSRWVQALKGLQPVVGRVIEYTEVQDCISLQEAAQNIARSMEVEQLVQRLEPASLCTRVALPEQEIRNVRLEQIAFSLMHGRDNFKERLACIAHAKEQLLDTLQAYIAAPEASHPHVWVHSVRMNDASLDAPVAPVETPGTETLSTWAEWWVRSKSAVLEWSVLYPQIARPCKFPLPAYPFQLDHIWYKTAEAKPQLVVESGLQLSVQPMKQPQVKSVADSLDEPFALPSRIVEAWNACMANSQLYIPSSMMSLAYLLDYAVYKNNGPAALENMVLGRPCDIQDGELVFNHLQDTGASIIQCVRSGDTQKILAQVSLRHSAVSLAAPITEAGSKQSLTKQQFIGQLENWGLSPGSILHCVQQIHADRQQIVMELDLPAWKERSGQYWAPFIASMLSGLAYLQQPQGAFCLPWKIQSAAFNPQPSQSLGTLYLKMDTDAASALLVDKSSNPVLQLEGIALRPSSSVRLRAQLEARAA